MKAFRTIRRKFDSVKVPEQSAIYPPELLDRKKKTKSDKSLFIELAAGGVVLAAMIFAVIAGQGIIRKQTGVLPVGVNTEETTTKSTIFSNGISWYCNQFGSIGEPPFPLPEGSPEIYQSYKCFYLFNHYSKADYERYVSSLEESGFELAKMKYSSFLFRDDCMIFLDYSEDDELLTMSWYSKSRYAKDDAESSSLSWYDGKDSLSKIKTHPINVTPEGFYDLTGGQIFAVPLYSFDRYKSAGYEELMSENNEHYNCSVCFVKDDTALNTSMESVAVCDIDGDQKNDVLLLSFGPTSGLFTFNVTVVTNDYIYGTVFSIFNMEIFTIGFANKDGRTVVEGVDKDLKQHFFDIVLEKDGDETFIMLYENEEPLQKWGTPGTYKLTREETDAPKETGGGLKYFDDKQEFYVSEEKSGESHRFTLRLDKNGHFSCREEHDEIFNSGSGIWKLVNGVLSLNEAGIISRFAVSDDGMTLTADKSAKNMFSGISEGEKLMPTKGDTGYLPNCSTKYIQTFNNDKLHVEEFIDILKSNGNESTSAYLYTKFLNETPIGIRSETQDVEIFRGDDGYQGYYIRYKDKVIKSEGSSIGCVYLWDYDCNGVKDLVSRHSIGYEMVRTGIYVTDLTTMKQTLIYVVPYETGVVYNPQNSLQFDYDGESVYINGQKITYSDGKFSCGSIFGGSADENLENDEPQTAIYNGMLVSKKIADALKSASSETRCDPGRHIDEFLEIMERDGFVTQNGTSEKKSGISDWRNISFARKTKVDVFVSVQENIVLIMANGKIYQPFETSGGTLVEFTFLDIDDNGIEEMIACGSWKRSGVTHYYIDANDPGTINVMNIAFKNSTDQ